MLKEENELEETFRMAASEPAHGPEFYRLLLESTIFIIGSSDQMDEGVGRPKNDFGPGGGMQVHIQE